MSRHTDKIVVAAVGDSITAGTPSWDPDPHVRRKIGAKLNPESFWPYWAQRANPSVDFRVSAADGERTDEVAARVERVADGANVLVVQAGINDIVQRRPPDMAAQSLRGTVRNGIERGLLVAIADLLPWNNGYPDYDITIRTLNLLIYDLARQEGAHLLPFHDVLEDPSRPGRMREEWTADGSHPSPAGHRRLGEMAFSLPSPSRMNRQRPDSSS